MIEPTSLLLVNDHDLKTDLAEFSAAIVRELYLAVRKLESPQLDFAMAQRVIDRPLSLLRKWFRLFRVADLDVSTAELSFGGVVVSESTFAAGLARLLANGQCRQLVFVPPISPPELHALLKCLGTPGDKGSLSAQLAPRGVRCIHVDSREWQERLSQRPVPVPDSSGQVLLESYILAHWSSQADLVCFAAAGSVPPADTLAQFWHCFATPQILEAVLSPAFATIPSQAILEHARARLEGESGQGEKPLARPPLAYWQGLIAAVVRHPYGYELTHALRELLALHKLPLNVDELLDVQVRLQYQATGVVDDLTSKVFSTACSVDDLKRWGPAFARLLKSGPSDQAATILEALLLHLKRDDREARRKAHYLLGNALAAAFATDDLRVIRWMSERIVADLVAGEETYEFSDLLAGAGEMLLSAGQWEWLSPLVSQLSTLAAETTHPARERVCQTVLERWRHPRWTTLLFRAAEEEVSGKEATDMLAALGGREIALKAASLITHTQRRVRLAMLEVLSRLGDEAVDICAELVAPPALWQRRNDGGILPEDSWYTIRNAFHIIGRIGGDRVLALLKEHRTDKDRRVRLEIVRALERIGSSDARAFLVELAEDDAVEVRRAAMSALGSAGGEHEVFALQEFFASDIEAAESALSAIGHIGGRAAKDFLFGVLEGDALSRPGYAARAEALKEAALKALVQNPDSEIVSRIETYCRNNKRTFRIPLVTDSLSDTGRIRQERARKELRQG